MQKGILPACLLLLTGASPARAGEFRDVSPAASEDRSSTDPATPALPRELADPLAASAVPIRGAGLSLVQEEIAPRLHFGLAMYARLDVPGDTSVDSIDNVRYSDLFDIGYGINAEASLLSWVSPHWALGGYLSIGWDQWHGASNVDMGTGEFFNFDNQDTVTVILGGKVLHHFAPFWFWEGRLGAGFVHYGELTFTDVTFPPAVPGLQFFKPINRGVFDLGGRIGVGDRQVTLDMGLDFRFQGGEARGKDVTDLIDPDWLFVFSIDLGVSFRF
jgi:hypothetical protein